MTEHRKSTGTGIPERPADDLFREEARRHLAEPELGELLRLSTWWVHGSWWLLVAVGCLACAFVACSSVAVYESGIAVIRVPAESRLAGAASPPTFIAVARGSARLRFAKNMEIDLRTLDRPGATLHAVIDSVGERRIGRDEARRLVGWSEETITSSGPVAWFSGHLTTGLPGAAVDADALDDGMLATARVRVRQEKVLFRLLPGLKPLWAG